MRRVCIWLLERALPPQWSDHVIGDLEEQRHRGTLWVLRQTIAALVALDLSTRMTWRMLSLGCTQTGLVG